MQSNRTLKWIALAIMVSAAGCSGSEEGADTDACGDGVCGDGETHGSCDLDCPADVACGDGFCNSGETHASCAADCPADGAVCGDSVCGGGETNVSCPTDCPAICGDHTCNGGETKTSCPADCPASGAFCGDGTCNGTETTNSCAADCPPAACTTSPDNCTGETICMNGSCVAAFGRVYKIIMIDGVLPQNDSTGATWDPNGGLPDPWIEPTLNGTKLGYSATKTNTLTPTWNQYLMATIPAGSNFQIAVLDDDTTDVPPSPSDPMFSCQNNPLTADLLRVHGAPYLSCNGPSGSKFRFYLQAQ